MAEEPLAAGPALVEVERGRVGLQLAVCCMRSCSAPRMIAKHARESPAVAGRKLTGSVTARRLRGGVAKTLGGLVNGRRLCGLRRSRCSRSPQCTIAHRAHAAGALLEPAHGLRPLGADRDLWLVAVGAQAADAAELERRVAGAGLDRDRARRQALLRDDRRPFGVDGELRRARARAAAASAVSTDAVGIESRMSLSTRAGGRGVAPGRMAARRGGAHVSRSR